MSEAGLRDRIVDTALALAAQSSWERLRLFQVAEALDIGLEEVRREFREKEDLIDAWFDRADAALLLAAADPALEGLNARERLHRLLMAWFDALAAHRRVSRQMIQGRLEPGHVHIQARGLLRVSRTVQWWREAAQREAAYLGRALEETVLTGIYLTSFAYWLNDESTESAGTRRLLDRLLRGSEWLPFMALTPRRGRAGQAGMEPHQAFEVTGADEQGAGER
jgi:ubiquinone biosynthesis protein COQ9